MKLQNLYLQISNGLLLAIAFTLPFPVAFNSPLIAFAVLLWFFQKDIINKIKVAFSKKLSLLFLLYLILHVLSVFISDNKQEAWMIVERRLSFVVFPFLLCNSGEGKLLKKTEISFLAGVIAALIICLFAAFYRFYLDGNSIHFYYHDYSSIIKINAVYLSAYTVFCIFILLNEPEIAGFFGKMKIPVILFFVLNCFLLSSKLMLMILFAGALFILFRQVDSWKRKIGFIISGLGLFLILFFIFPRVQERFLKEFNTNMDVVNLDKFNYDTPFTGTSLRLVLWKSSLQVLNNEGNLFMGVGTGDMQELLDEKYKEINLYTGNPKLNDRGYLGYEPHNQYIECLLGLGTSALFVLVLIFYFQLQFFFKNKDLTGFFLTLLIAIFCITESALSSNKGIVFFSFFTFLLYYRDVDKRINYI